MKLKSMILKFLKPSPIQIGALPSSTFALCLASGTSNGGTLFLGGVPTQPGGAPYDVTYTGPLFRNPYVFFIIPNPTDVLLNGNPVANAASALQSDTNAGSKWIVDSGTLLVTLNRHKVLGLCMHRICLRSYSELMMTPKGLA